MYIDGWCSTRFWLYYDPFAFSPFCGFDIPLLRLLLEPVFYSVLGRIEDQGLLEPFGGVRDFR